MGRSVALILLAALSLLVSACVSAPPPPPPPPEAPPPAVRAAAPEQKLSLVRTTFEKLPGWRGDSHMAAIAPLLRSCRRLANMADQKRLGYGAAAAGTVAAWRPICAAAGQLSGRDAALARRFFERWFDPYLATADGRPEGLFTGYFEMELKGSWIKTGTYTTPIYELPPDVATADLGEFRAGQKGGLVGKIAGKRFVPYDTRAEIDGGSIADRGSQPILWVDSPVDAFFLHVQGSGRVIMGDGSIVRLGYAGRNGRPYRSIGAELIRRGELTRERTSMQSIRAWLRDHPGQAAALMAGNPSYIFFRVVEGALKPLDPQQGPVGAAGVPLTPGRSLAVDRRYIPLGLPVWLDTTDPLDPGQPLRRLVITQDTGSAIKGPVRGDLFWGFGAAAATRAGLMKQPGRYFLLLPKRR